MDKILQELYRGMIHPQEEYRPMDEEYRQTQKVLDQERKILLEQIGQNNSELRAEVEGMLERITELEAMELEEVYIQGMRMGARLALELLGKNSA